jgi:regulator of cell morphogenesis and NO signaling
MSLQIDNTTTVGEIVAADFRAAAVFEKFGLDFCCGGKRTLEEACTARQVDLSAIAAELETLQDGPALGDIPDQSWAVDELAQYIVRRHHGYVRRQMPTIGAHLEKLVSVHGDRHPELRQIADHFAELAGEMHMHMMKEEEILFPYVRALALAAESRQEPPSNMFGTVRNPIRMMEMEHQSAGDELAAIRELSGGYRAPADGCTTYQVTYQELQAFEADLRQHIHLENNILFPRAVSLEAALNALSPRL